MHSRKKSQECDGITPARVGANWFLKSFLTLRRPCLDTPQLTLCSQKRSLVETAPMDSLAILEQAVISNDYRTIDSELLSFSRLDTYAYHTLPPAQRSALLQAVMTEALHHQIVKADVHALCHACHKAGIQVLIFKGFSLAEFFYDTPEQRFYADVDILIHDGDLIALRELAFKLGWKDFKDVIESDKTHHEPLGLVSEEDTYIDVHRYIVPQHLGLHNKRRFTMLAWQKAQRREWEGTSVYILPPVLAALYGLILARAWTGDGWNLKAHDYLDLQCLKRAGLTEGELLHEAQSQRLGRTTRLYLERCNPWQEHLELRSTTAWQRLRWRALTIRERPDTALLDYRRIRRVLRSIRREFPHLLWALKHLQRGPTVAALPKQAETLGFNDGGQAVTDSAHGVRWASLPWRAVLSRERFSLLRALALYHSLHCKRVPVVLVKGVDAHGEHYHWIENRGAPVALKDVGIIEAHREVERFPGVVA